MPGLNHGISVASKPPVPDGTSTLQYLYCTVTARIHIHSDTLPLEWPPNEMIFDQDLPRNGWQGFIVLNLVSL